MINTRSILLFVSRVSVALGLLLLSIQSLAVTIDKAQFLLLSEQPHSTQISPIPAPDLFVARAEQRTLPDYWDIHGPQLGGQGWYQLDFQLDEQALQRSDSWAIYVPKHSRVLELYLNGRRVGDTGQFSDHLSYNFVIPYLFPIHSSLLYEGDNQIHIRLAGYDYDATLSKVYVDTEANLNKPYRWRYGFHVDVARGTSFWMLLLAIIVLAFWSIRRKERLYLWFAMSCLAGAVYSCDRFLPDMPMFLADARDLVFNAAISFYTLFSVLFLHRFLDVNRLRYEQLYCTSIALYFIAMLTLPQDQAYNATNLMHLVNGYFGLYTLYMLFKFRHRNGLVDSYVFLGIWSFAYLLDINDLLIRIMEPPYTDINFIQWSPLLSSLSLLWLMFSRLFRTLNAFESLNRELHQRVETKSAQIVELEKQKLIADERQRIMFDLHDGVGGQLVNAVNYLHTQDKPDAVLQDSLQSALQDLRLIIESINMEDQRDTEHLLSLLRDRIEPVIARQGIELVWEVGKTPKLPMSQPSASLDLSRLLQEAVTNVIKHANANKIYLRTDASSIEIEDDGVGIDWEKPAGVGINSMEKRAKRIGMSLSISGSDRGTLVRLSLC